MLLRTSLTFMLLISPFSLAETLQDKLLNCAQNNDSLQRLVCYDKLTESLKVKEVKVQPIAPSHNRNIAVKKPDEPKKVVMPVTAKAIPIAPTKTKLPEPAKNPEEQEAAALAKFGNENKQAPEVLIEQIHAKVSKVSKGVYGQYVITLENQQVWRQTDKIRLKIKPGQIINIERGLMGSFFMGTEQVKKRIRVKRVK